MNFVFIFTEKKLFSITALDEQNVIMKAIVVEN